MRDLFVTFMGLTTSRYVEFIIMFSHVALQIEVLKYQDRFPHEQKSWSFFCKHSNMPQCKTAQLIVEVGRGGGQLIVEVGSNKKWLLKMNFIVKGHQCDQMSVLFFHLWTFESLKNCPVV